MQQVYIKRKEKKWKLVQTCPDYTDVKLESKLVQSLEVQSIQVFPSLMCLLSKIQIAVPLKASGTPSCEQNGLYQLSQSALQMPIVRYDEFTGLMAAFSCIPHLAKASGCAHTRLH